MLVKLRPWNFDHPTFPDYLTCYLTLVSCWACSVAMRCASAVSAGSSGESAQRHHERPFHRGVFKLGHDRNVVGGEVAHVLARQERAADVAG